MCESLAVVVVVVGGGGGGLQEELLWALTISQTEALLSEETNT